MSDPINICPTCGQVLKTTHLGQLNATLKMLLNDIKSMPGDERTKLTKQIVDEIERVSKSISHEAPPAAVKT
jgi:hypothetical protein